MLGVEDVPEAAFFRRHKRTRRRAGSAPGRWRGAGMTDRCSQGAGLCRRPARPRVLLWAFSSTGRAGPLGPLPEEDEQEGLEENVEEVDAQSSVGPAVRAARATSAPPTPARPRPAVSLGTDDWPSLREAITGWDFCSVTSEAGSMSSASRSWVDVQPGGAIEADINSRACAGVASSATGDVAIAEAPASNGGALNSEAEVSSTSEGSWVEVRTAGARRAGAWGRARATDAQARPSFAELLRGGSGAEDGGRSQGAVALTPQAPRPVLPPADGVARRAPPPPRRRHQAAPEPGNGGTGQAAACISDDDEDWGPLGGDSRCRGWSKGMKSSRSVRNRVQVAYQVARRQEQSAASRAANRGRGH